MKKKNISGTIIIGLWLLMSILIWLSPSQEISLDERRALASFPKLTKTSLLSGSYMQDFDKASQDQFPWRFTFRKIKAQSQTKIFRQKDNQDIYLKEGHAAKLDYKLNKRAIEDNLALIEDLANKYGQQSRNFLAIIPDKTFYLAGQDYPSLDFDYIFKHAEDKTNLKFIDFRDKLSLDDYYKTDSHWRQEKLLPLVNYIAQEMEININTSNYEKALARDDFRGVYYGLSALELPKEELFYLNKKDLENIQVYNLEEDSYDPIYDLSKIDSREPYDIFMSGPAALQISDNPQAKSDRQLVIFRDSYGSSLAPLLMEGYARTILVDLRYIKRELLEDYIDFSETDLLFIYSTSILNTSSIFK